MTGDGDDGVGVGVGDDSGRSVVWWCGVSWSSDEVNVDVDVGADTNDALLQQAPCFGSPDGAS